MNKIELLCTVDDNGKITSGRSKLIKALQSFSGKRITLIIERQFKKRSGQQNRYLHGVVLPMVQERLIELGWNEAASNEWVKDLVKMKFLKTEFVNETTGEVLPMLRHTSGLTTTQMMDLIAEIQMWAANDLDLYIPDPNEQTKLFK